MSRLKWQWSDQVAVQMRIRKLVAVSVGLFGMGALGLFMASDVQLNAKSGMGPVLPLSAPAFDLPFLTEATRDPSILNKKPETEGDASRLADELKEFRADLTRAQGERAAELHEMAYQSAAALAYYFEDVLSGRIESAENRASAPGNLATIRTMVVHHAGQAARLLKSDAAKSRALFHVFATQYAMGQGQAKAADSLAKLAAGKMDSRLKSRAALIAGLYKIDHGSASEKARAETTLKRVVGSLPASGQVAVRLTLARSLAGLNRSGKRVAGSHASYRNHLAAAAQRAGALAPAHKDMALRAMIGIWRGAEGQGINYASVPFSMKAFAGALDTKAIIERSALQDWAKNNRPNAMKKYQTLSRGLTGNVMRGSIDLRILDMKRSVYVESRDPRPYEAALLAMSKAYLDPGLLGDGQEAKAKTVAAEVTRRHQVLVHGELARVVRAGVSSSERQKAIRMADAFLSTISDNAEIEDVKAKIAGVYAINKQHGKAVALYKELAETGNQANAKKYWALAIRSQTVLAAWSETVPWNGVKAGSLAEREELLLLYKKFGDADATNWFVAAHVGLLEINAGRDDAAYASWSEMLKKDVKGVHAANAAGTMLTAYKKASDWSNLEQLARLAIAGRMQPQYHGNTVLAVDMLALALLEGGKSALDQGQFAVAVTKLKEFVKNHAAAKNHDEGFFLLATAYRSNSQHPDAIKTLLAFVDRYPKSGYYRQALLNGGDWSSAMAYEENVMFFQNRFVVQFGNDPEAQRIRAGLTELYVGRSLYAEAIGVLSLTARAKVEQSIQTDAMYQIMDLEERHGSMAQAAQAADRLIKDQGASDEAKAQALGLKARIAARDGRFDEVRSIESRLAAYSGGPQGQEALGETRYLLAVSNSKLVTKRYFNLALKDPTTTLKQRFGAFSQVRTSFNRVCEAGTTSFCAPSMHQLARLSEEFMRSIEDIDVQNTLAKEVVDSFNKYKQSVMNDATATAEKSDGRAVHVISEGTTNPDWVQAVLWQNNADWNFERVSGEAGNGYIQWNEGAAASSAE